MERALTQWILRCAQDDDLEDGGISGTVVDQSYLAGAAIVSVAGGEGRSWVEEAPLGQRMESLRGGLPSG